MLMRRADAGHTAAQTYLSNPSDKVVNDKQAKGETVTLEDLNPGLAWSLDFSENMGEIIAVHGELC